MAKKNENSTPKRRWWQTFTDAYKVVRRSYKWAPAVLIALPIILIGAGIALGLVLKNPFFWILTAVMLAVVADMSLLAYLLRPAMYKQMEGKIGSAYAAFSQIRRGWVINEEPVAASKNQDIIWRLVGRPGVVLVSEGPSNRVLPMLQNERKRISRAVTNVPIVFIQMGREEGQVPLPKLLGALRKQKKVLTKHEVPAVANRLNSLGSHGISAPKGVDPYKTHASARRVIRGQ